MRNPNPDPAEMVSMEIRFNKYEGGLDSQKSFGVSNSINSFSVGGPNGNMSEGGLSPTKKGPNMYKKALTNNFGMPQVDSFKSTNTMGSINRENQLCNSNTSAGKEKAPETLGGKKTSLHELPEDFEKQEEELTMALRLKKVSSFHKKKHDEKAEDSDDE